MPNVTEVLMEDHVLILKFADLLEAALLRLEQAPAGDGTPSLWADLDRMRRFIQIFADDFHHLKEEKILFEFLSKPGVLPHCDPVEQMLYEHSIGRDCVRGFVEAIGKTDNRAAAKHGRGWIEMIRPHIDKEDHVLYRFAEDGLCDFDKEEIGKLYASADLEKKASSLRQEYGALEKELRARYLG